MNAERRNKFEKKIRVEHVDSVPVEIQIGSGLETAYAAVASLLDSLKQFLPPIFMPYAVSFPW